MPPGRGKRQGREGKEEGKGREEKAEGREHKGREGEGHAPKYFGLEPPLEPRHARMPAGVHGSTVAPSRRCLQGAPNKRATDSWPQFC